MYNTSKPYTAQILNLIKSTWNSPHASIEENTYSVIKKNFNYPEVDHTDGIGTKGFYHWQKRTFKNAVLDVLAMNLNDLALIQAIPYKLQNHILIPKDDTTALLEIIETLAGECKKRQIAITGGETSIHDNINGLDISVTVSGFIKNFKPNRFEIGDTLIGLKSNGLHSNGFTKVREIFGNEFKLEFVEPTIIYSDKILSLSEQFDIHGMMHITGGAFTKLKGLLNNANAIITKNHKLQPQQIFKDLHHKGITDEEMYRTFNCGVGFILSAKPQDVEKIIFELEPSADVIGSVIAGSGKVKIQSAFSDKELEL